MVARNVDADLLGLGPDPRAAGRVDPAGRDRRHVVHGDLTMCGSDRAACPLLVAPIREPWRPRLPAVTHVDGTARIQTVTSDDEPRLHALLKAFEKHAGVPVLLNTSFNRAGEPIVETPDDALDMFLETELDALVLEDFWAEKARVD